MNIKELIKLRRTIHQYTTQKVPESTMTEALELASWAPNHRMTMPWKFISLGSATRAKIAELAMRIKSEKKPISEIERQVILKSYLDVSHLFLILQKKSENLEVQSEDYASIAMGIQNIGLFLWSHGIGSKWSTGKVTGHHEMLAWCGVDINMYTSKGFLWVGYADKIPAPPVRPKVSAIVSFVD
jgi:nitroreductase